MSDGPVDALALSAYESKSIIRKSLNDNDIEDDF